MINLRTLTLGLLLSGAIFLPSAAEAKVSRPVKVSIPAIGVQAMIDGRGLTRAGNMQAPSGASRVAWYQTGAMPGQPGDAVMYGHLTDTSFRPAVFARLNKLKVNNRIVVTDAGRWVHTFRVTKLAAYKTSHMTFNQLVGKTKFSHLNVYTCAGSWSPLARQYTHFLIVYTTLVSSKPA